MGDLCQTRSGRQLTKLCNLSICTRQIIIVVIIIFPLFQSLQYRWWMPIHPLTKIPPYQWAIGGCTKVERWKVSAQLLKTGAVVMIPGFHVILMWLPHESLTIYLLIDHEAVCPNLGREKELSGVYYSVYQARLMLLKPEQLAFMNSEVTNDYNNLSHTGEAPCFTNIFHANFKFAAWAGLRVMFDSVQIWVTLGFQQLFDLCMVLLWWQTWSLELVSSMP